MPENVRVRFAPSPTGYLHMGGARTAIFNWLFARQTGGVFILRIEDTDIQRSSQEMVQGILDGLHWLGLDPDEGPFYQSSHVEEHRAAAQRLLESSKAYYDFSPREQASDHDVKERGAERARAESKGPRELNPFRDFPLDEARKRIDAGESAAIRLKVPLAGSTRFDDIVYGPQERAYSEIEDLVLIRSDGHPLYNLSVVVDDLSMGITHVIRGQDHLTNTHKQVLLYEALGAPVPQFAHLPLILAPGKEKLSKRKHGEVVSVTTYRERGFLPEALFNFLVLLGWSPGDDREVLSRAELVQEFSLRAINKASAVFNFSEKDSRDWTDPKALWMNGEYIKAIPVEDLGPMVADRLKKAGLWKSEYDSEERDWFLKTVDLLRARYRTLNDFAELGRPYFSDEFAMEPQSVKKNLSSPALKELMPALADELTAIEFNHDSIEAAFRRFAESRGVKAGLLINGARTALTGQSVGPGMFEIAVALGQKRTVDRLRRAAALIQA